MTTRYLPARYIGGSSAPSPANVGRTGPAVRDLIAAARIRHWSFTDVQLGDGAALLFLNQRQRTLLADYGAEIEGLVGTTVQYTTTVTNGVLIALDATGAPTYNTTYKDGWPVHLDPVTAVPYIDTSEPQVAGDPFGQHGGVPGFPLPADFIRLTNVALVYTNNAIIPCDVIEERARFSVRPGRNPMAFLSGNRLVPLLPLASGNTGDRWFAVQAVQLSYVAMQTLTALADVVTLPTVLCEALTADLASLFADQSKACTQAERAAFAAKAQQAASRIGAASVDLVDSVQQSSIHFRG